MAKYKYKNISLHIWYASENGSLHEYKIHHRDWWKATGNDNLSREWMDSISQEDAAWYSFFSQGDQNVFQIYYAIGPQRKNAIRRKLQSL